MQSHIRLGRIFGVDIGLHYSWFIIALLIMFALGGVARIEKEAVDPQTELLMGIIGPVTSVVIGMICLGLARASGWTPMATPAHPLAAITLACKGDEASFSHFSRAAP
jgi:Zn-dependent protease